MKTFLKISFAITLVATTLESCDKIRRKSEELADKVSPKFDPTNPNSRFNQKRFAEFFGFEPTNDITNLYCYANEFGIDASYYFSFKCNAITVQKIKDSLELTYDSTTYGLNGFEINYKWWDNDKIKTIKPLVRQDGTLHWYLWYDQENEQVYFLTFDT